VAVANAASKPGVLRSANTSSMTEHLGVMTVKETTVLVEAARTEAHAEAGRCRLTPG